MEVASAEPGAGDASASVPVCKLDESRLDACNRPSDATLPDNTDDCDDLGKYELDDCVSVRARMADSVAYFSPMWSIASLRSAAQHGII